MPAPFGQRVNSFNVAQQHNVAQPSYLAAKCNEYFKIHMLHICIQPRHCFILTNWFNDKFYLYFSPKSEPDATSQEHVPDPRSNRKRLSANIQPHQSNQPRNHLTNSPELFFSLSRTADHDRKSPSIALHAVHQSAPEGISSSHSRPCEQNLSSPRRSSLIHQFPVPPKPTRCLCRSLAP